MGGPRPPAPRFIITKARLEETRFSAEIPPYPRLRPARRQHRQRPHFPPLGAFPAAGRRPGPPPPLPRSRAPPRPRPPPPKFSAPRPAPPPAPPHPPLTSRIGRSAEKRGEAGGRKGRRRGGRRGEKPGEAAARGAPDGAGCRGVGRRGRARPGGGGGDVRVQVPQVRPARVLPGPRRCGG